MQTHAMMCNVTLRQTHAMMCNVTLSSLPRHVRHHRLIYLFAHRSLLRHKSVSCFMHTSCALLLGTYMTMLMASWLSHKYVSCSMHMYPVTRYIAVGCVTSMRTCHGLTYSHLSTCMSILLSSDLMAVTALSVHARICHLPHIHVYFTLECVTRHMAVHCIMRAGMHASHTCTLPILCIQICRTNCQKQSLACVQADEARVA